MMVVGLVFAELLALQVPQAPASSWEAPPECPTRAGLDAVIARRLGRPLVAGEALLVGRVTLTGLAPRYRLTLRLAAGGRDELRHLTAERCAVIVEATALLVALAVGEAAATTLPTGVDDDAVIPPPRTRDAATPSPGVHSDGADRSAPRVDELRDELAARTELPDPTTLHDPPTTAQRPVGAPVTPPPTLPSIASTDALTYAADAARTGPRIASGRRTAPPIAGLAPARRRRIGGLLRVHGGAELGALPGGTGGVGLAGALLWRRARIELQGGYLAPRTAVQPEGALRAFLVGGALLGCGRLGRGRVEVPLCGGLELAALRGEGRDVSAPRSVTGLWLAGVLSAGAVVRLDRRWGVWSALQGVARVTWPRFELRDPGPTVRLFEPGPVSGRLLLGVELRFADPR